VAGFLSAGHALYAWFKLRNKPAAIHGAETLIFINWPVRLDGTFDFYLLTRTWPSL
jgi:hypothetical protein